MDSRELATEIRRHLTVGGQAKRNFMYWGANAFKYDEDKGENLGYLRFKVSGLLFKGIVKISLMFNDTYKVEFIKNKRVKNVMLSNLYGKNKFDTIPTINEDLTMTDVYCDVLNECIDRTIEQK